MRDLVFTLEYDPGRNAVADALAEHPSARIRSLSLHATTERLWRVDHVTGDPAALDAIQAAFQTSDYYADCLASADCGATQTTRVLEHTDEMLVLYSDWERTPSCASVPHIALAHLGEGALFETRHQQRRYTWRIIHAGTGDVPAFFDALEGAIGEGASLTVERLTDTTPPTEEPGDDGGLPVEQEVALQAAVEHGYYETPREIDVGGLADRLGVPRSTLTYRLRRAEAYLAARHVSNSRLPESSPPTI